MDVVCARKLDEYKTHNWFKGRLQLLCFSYTFLEKHGVGCHCPHLRDVQHQVVGVVLLHRVRHKLQAHPLLAMGQDRALLGKHLQMA